jgi:hypothetical protein
LNNVEKAGVAFHGRLLRLSGRAGRADCRTY